MTNEEKKLLIIDLCGRLPYGVKICVDGYICTLLDINTEMSDKLNVETFHVAGFNKPNGDYNFCSISEVKPYLRPMSSMTDAEKKTLNNILEYQYCSDDSCMCEASDWLSEHHFDYRGLIEKGLALEALEGMYNN